MQIYTYPKKISKDLGRNVFCDMNVASEWRLHVVLEIYFSVKKEGEGKEMRRKKVIFVAQKRVYVGFCFYKVIG